MSAANDNGLINAECVLCGKVGFPGIIAMSGRDSLFICSAECAKANGLHVPIRNSEIIKRLI